jgi:cytochrome c
MPSFFTSLTRRAAIAAGGGLLAAPALTQPVCELGLQGHAEGPHVWRDCDKVEVDAAYSQELYPPHTEQVNSRLSSFVLNPVVARPGIDVEMQGFPDDPERTDLIADLRKLSDEPIPLP